MTNPLLTELKARLPGVTVSLPTGGLYYAEGTLAKDTDPANLMVQPFSMWQEVHFRDPYKIAAGTAMRDMIRQVCPEVEKPDMLAAVDVEAIMVASRIASYGPDMEVEIACTNPGTRLEELSPEEAAKGTQPKVLPACVRTSTMKIDLNQMAQKYAFIGAPEDYRVTLPNGQVVQVAPIRYMTTMEMIKLVLRRKRQFTSAVELTIDPDTGETEMRELMDDTIKTGINMLRDAIAWVRTTGGATITDSKMIGEWLDVIPVAWSTEIGKTAERMNDAVKNAGCIRFECPDCHHVQEAVNVVNDPARFFSHASPTSPPPQRSPTSSASRGTRAPSSRRT